MKYLHEVYDAVNLPPSDVLEHNDGVFARVVSEDLLEIWAESRK